MDFFFIKEIKARFNYRKRIKQAIAYKKRARYNKLYINCNDLKPGDILLTRRKGILSSIIAYVSLGPFSHAALVVNQSSLIESTGIGIGYTPLQIDRIEKRKDEWKLMSELHDIKHAVVLSCEYLNENHKSSEQLLETIDKVFGKEYPNLYELSNTILPVLGLRKIAKIFLYIINRFRKNKVPIPGPFCSQLVAMIYNDLGVPIFSSTVKPENVHPNSFLRKSKTKNELYPIDCAICSSDPNIQTDYSFTLELKKLRASWGVKDRDSMLKPIIEGNRNVAIYKEISDKYVNALTSLENLLKVINDKTNLDKS